MRNLKRCFSLESLSLSCPELPEDSVQREADRLDGLLKQIEAEGNEMDQVLREVRRVAHPEFGVPRPKAWKAILRRHPFLPLPAEPNLTWEQEAELAKKLKASGRLKRVRSRWWNPWAAQDEAKDAALHAIHRFIEKAYDGKVSLAEWKAFRRKHRTLELPVSPKLTLSQYFATLRRIPKCSYFRTSKASLYSLIKW